MAFPLLLCIEMGQVVPFHVTIMQQKHPYQQLDSIIMNFISYQMYLVALPTKAHSYLPENSLFQVK